MDNNPILDDELFPAELTMLERRRLRNLEDQAEDLEKHIKGGRIALYVLAGLSLVSILTYYNSGLSMEDSLLEGLVMFAIYLAAALMSYRYPMASIGFGLFIYLLIQIFSAVTVPASIIRGIIFKILFVYYLVMAVTSASRLKSVQKAIQKLRGGSPGDTLRLE